MSIFSSIGKVFGTILTVVGQLSPILDLLKQLVPGLRDSITQLETLVEEGETQADDFIDANRPGLEKARDFAEKLEFAGAGLKNTIQMTLDSAAANDDTPEEVTAAEVGEIYESLEETIKLIIDAGESAGPAMEAVEKFKPKQ